MSDITKVGILNVHKPLHITSHDVVAQIRRRYLAQSGSRKVGHAGTLDPLADGVLVVCLGAATRLSDFLMAGEKVYRAEVTLGRTTTSYDAAGEIVAERDASQVSLADIKIALPQFLGDISQIPPLYSAIKVGGKKLYEYARQGKSVERKARQVTIHDIEILSWLSPVLVLEIRCGAGTYIRSLAHDLGEILGVGAYLSGLTRLASGAFKLEDSISLDEVLQDDTWLRQIIAPYRALEGQTRVTLNEEEIEEVRHGRFIPKNNDIDDATVFAFDAQRQLIAILEPREQYWKPRKVFSNQA